MSKRIHTSQQLVAAILLACGVSLMTGPASAATPAQPTTQPTSQPALPGGSLTADELDNLLGPIALYPDALLANVLAASVYPDEVQQAAGFVRGGGDKKMIDSRSWEDPVKAIAKVPDVARMMGEYMDWTVAIGQAYLTQAQDVMASVQRLRKKAQANGALKTTDQQKVVVEQDTVYIQSPDPEVVYVPYYQPGVVYVDDSDDEWAAGVIGFGAGVVVGAVWADLACDWHHGCIGWGHSDVDIDINRGDINTGDINIGNRVEHRGARVGQEGNAWSPNRAKPLATSRPAQAQSVRAGAAGRPQVSSGGRAPAGMSRAPAAAPRPAARPAAPAARTPTPSAGRTPAVPPAQRAQSAYRGGGDTRASSSRGASSRGSAQRSSGGGRSVPSRGGGRGGGRGGRR